MRRMVIMNGPLMWTPPLPLSPNEEVVDSNGQTYNELTLEDMRMDTSGLSEAGCDLDRSILALKQVEKNIKSESCKRFTDAYENYKKSKKNK